MYFFFLYYPHFNSQQKTSEILNEKLRINLVFSSSIRVDTEYINTDILNTLIIS